VIEMSVSNQDVLDVSRIEAGSLDVLDYVLDIWFLRGVDQNQSVTRGDEPDRHKPGTNVIEIVEDLDGRNFLVLDVLSLAPAIALAQGLAGSRSGILQADRRWCLSDSW
jgi:hypothetical protein